MKKFNKQSFIKNLLSFSPRQGKNAIKSANYIEKTLNDYGVSFFVEKFQAEIPASSAILKIDDKKIDCVGCSFISGKITSKNSIVSSLIPSRFLINYPNINFNPECDTVSVSNFYFEPAIAVSKKDIPNIINSINVFGEVKTKKIKTESRQIIVGNLKNPMNILFGHYDSIGSGATDNASGVAVMVDIIVSNPQVLKNCLFVFDGNEELSYDYPTYWGYGYRVFESKYGKLLKNTCKIFVIDCVGNGKTEIGNSPEILSLSFPILTIDKLKNKIFSVSGNIEKLMKVYHSNKDTKKELKDEYLNEAVSIVVKEIF